MIKLNRVIIMLSIIAATVHVNAEEEVTTIYGDFNGFTTSSSTSVVTTDDSNNLLGFTTAEGTFSTGVNDAELSANGVSFTALEFQAFPTPDFTESGLVGVPSNWGGVAQGATGSVTTGSEAPNFYTMDGEQGLELGTVVFNITRSTVTYDFSVSSDSFISDGQPDIIVTQMGVPSTTQFDVFSFVDVDGNVVGNSLAVQFGSITPVGEADYAFYNIDTSTGTRTIRGFNPSERDTRLLTFGLEDFGLNSGNFSDVVGFSQRFSGTADTAFAAFNKQAISLTLPPATAVPALNGFGLLIAILSMVAIGRRKFKHQ